MNHFITRRRWLVVLSVSAGLLFAIAFRADAQSPPQPAPPSAAPPSPQDDAAAKAAERKKKFEESRKLLEEADPPLPAPRQTPAQSKDNPATARPVVNPLAVVLPLTMEIGENQRFLLYTKDNKDVTSSADWTVDDASVAELRMIDGIPHLYGKSKGRTDVYANVNGLSALVPLTVIPKEEMTSSTVRWRNPDGPGGLLKIVPFLPQRDPSHF